MKVLALDPGVTTGHATGLIENGWMGVISGQDQFTELQLYKSLELLKPDIIIYERFDYRSQAAYNVTAAELFPRNLIGIIKMYKEEVGDSLALYEQMPAQALGKKAYWNNDRLRQHGVYKVANPHANDAMRHLLYWYKFGPGYKYNQNGFELLA